MTTGNILGTLLVAVVAFTGLSPQLGGTPTDQADRRPTRNRAIIRTANS
ncbi:MAG: hypothetical protein WKG07_48160 [Hymenobacter sp.]